MSSTPTPYNRQANFVTDAQGNANITVSQIATELDAEFDAINTSVDGTQSRLAELQRDDGGLLNGVVTPQSLSADTLSFISNNNAYFKGSWVTAKAYAIGESVANSGTVYYCVVAHTSGTFATDLSASKWVASSTTISSASNLTTGTLPDARLSANVVTLTGTQTLTNKSISAAQITGLSTGQVSGLAAVASTGSASDLGSGTLPDARLSTVATAGTFGSSTLIPSITIDTKGRVTSVATNSVSTLSTIRVRPVKFAEINGGNGASVGTYRWTSFLDSMGYLRFAGTGLQGRFGIGVSLNNSSTGGRFFTGQIPFTDSGEAVAKYYTGVAATFVLSTTGNVYSTGGNGNGALGLGDLVDRNIFYKVAISNVAQLSVAGDGDEANAYHVLAVTTSGALYGWGYNGYGQLGDNSVTQRTSPVLINGGDIAGKTITKCFAFGYIGHSFVIDSNRDLYATGYNASGQLGLGDVTQRQVFRKVSLVKADSVYGVGGANGTYVRGSSWIIWDGAIYGTGSNQSYEVNSSNTDDKTSFQQIGSITTASSLAVSSNYANVGASVAALLSNGTVRVWGKNSAQGQLGINGTSDQQTPTTLSGFASTTFSKIQFIGHNNNGARFFALATSGQLYVCGASGDGAGDGGGGAKLVLTPVRQYGGLTFTDFRVYGSYADVSTVLAMTASGELWAWGYNNEYQTGFGTSLTQISTPQRVDI